MADILSGAVRGGGAFLFAWVFPSAIVPTAPYGLVLRRPGTEIATAIAPTRLGNALCAFLADSA